MTCGTDDFSGDGSDAETKDGIFANHAYSMLAAHDLTKNG
jgi:hypothetical protein